MRIVLQSRYMYMYGLNEAAQISIVSIFGKSKWVTAASLYLINLPTYFLRIINNYFTSVC